MDEEEFKTLLETCRLEIGEEEKSKNNKDIDEILEYFNQLDHIDCTDISAAFQPIEVPERLRDDTVEEFSDIDGILKNTTTHRSYVVGPKV